MYGDAAMDVLILANGDPPSRNYAQAMAARHRLLLATDGAAHRAAELGLTPHIICGDFDSVRLEEAKRTFPLAEFLPTPDQDHADLEKAIEVAQERGASHINVLGALGGRIDHTLANFALLLRYPYRSSPISLAILDDTSSVMGMVGGEEAVQHELPAHPGETVSLISLDGRAHVSISGVQWPLDDYRLPSGTQGVSNVAETERVTVRVRGGGVLVCRLYIHP